MNPLFVVPLFVYAAAATAWPNQVDGRRRGMALLWVEIAIVAVAPTIEDDPRFLQRIIGRVFIYQPAHGAKLVRRQNPFSIGKPFVFFNFTPEMLQQWIRSPSKFKPGTRMPQHQLKQDDLSDLVEYLESLK